MVNMDPAQRGLGTEDFLDNLQRTAASSHLFVAKCANYVSASPCVEIVPEALESLVPLVAAAKPISWSWYLPVGCADPRQALAEFAFNAGLNGGYFMRGADGSVVQWQKDGSGSTALLEWIALLRADKAMPLFDIREPFTVRDRLRPRLDGLPHAAARLAIMEEFADVGRSVVFADVIEMCRKSDGSAARWSFGMDAVRCLACAYPLAFAGDPFLKKALLALMMFAGWLDTSGDRVVWDAPLPADYQIPRMLHWKGVIRVSPTFESMLRTSMLLDVRSQEVTAFRAAAVVAARDLARRAGRDDRIVDGALFGCFRKDSAFIAESLPPMKCDSMWF